MRSLRPWVAGLALAVACTDAAETSSADASSVVIGDARAPDARPGPIDIGPAVDSGLADAADLDTGTPDAGTLCDEAAVAVVTATAVAERAALLDGEVIVVTGTITQGTIRCTTIACEEPCCNTCSAALSVGPLVLVESACFSTPECRGTECGVVCRPPTLGLPARYRGVLRAQPLELELIAVE